MLCTCIEVIEVFMRINLYPVQGLELPRASSASACSASSSSSAGLGREEPSRGSARGAEQLGKHGGGGRELDTVCWGTP